VRRQSEAATALWIEVSLDEISGMLERPNPINALAIIRERRKTPRYLKISPNKPKWRNW
jgi:hypothetical protein